MKTLMVCVNLALIAIIAQYLWNLGKRNAQNRDRIAAVEKSLAQFMKEFPVLINADLVIARQMREFNAQIVSMDNHLQELENKRDNDGGYQHALRILEMGGNREEIVNSCHLSPAEADLLINLQAYRSAFKTA